MKVVAVTGASGHLGNVVCSGLLESGYYVRAMYHSFDTSLKDLPLELVQGDVLNAADVQRLLGGCDMVINCAAIISIHGDPTGIVYKTNTAGPKIVLETASRLGIKRIVHVSSVHAVLEVPTSLPFDEKRPYKSAEDYPYDYSKAVGEQLLFNTQIENKPEIVVLRPSCIVGPFDFKPSEIGKVLLQFYHQQIPVLPQGGYDFVDVRDVANSVISALTQGRDGEVYLVTGKYYSMKLLARIIEKVSGKKTPKMVMHYWVLRTLGFAQK
ncbi:MAG: NAD-dependent epimerase/dehydratase family protein [Saprospiraceae bacterium]|nr:NAD-dependent epimerase/dehydratase family protein [Saprospiraceae bacterium]MCF8252790.1 NAD-dependent epimerase/dehydratase family protein [Saprospiraceae bacterium]MCF8283216.1 NAD-dependent epimerase/dehydratase family protein [Bacteroidales bacterium]MCF8314345.1 NAD-dependent epimerase/dehydratase family protein [Saprospiraceae bacterium]MCF8443221.1 NAD-dependent epimerase/dehydratase family protein [Saprospiraceae bacterium]